jgi:hypothetical protein
MNKRTEELMLEAGYAAPHLAGRAHKLVDLIVKECEIALHPMLRDMVSRGQAVEIIKEHFGVK